MVCVSVVCGGWLVDSLRDQGLDHAEDAHTHTHTQAVVETQLIKHTHIKADKQKAQPPHSVVDMCLSRVSAHHPLTPPMMMPQQKPLVLHLLYNRINYTHTMEADASGFSALQAPQC